VHQRDRTAHAADNEYGGHQARTRKQVKTCGNRGLLAVDVIYLATGSGDQV